MWWCSGGMYNVQCRPSFKEAVCVCCCVYYCRVSGLYPHHPLPEEYIHGVLVFILKIRTKSFQKSFFVKMTQSYNWLRVIVIFSYFLKSLAWLVFAFLTYVRCSEEHTEEEECVGGNCELLSPLSSLLSPTLRCKLGLAASLNNCASPSAGRTGETEHISILRRDTMDTLHTAGSTMICSG